MIPYGRQTIGRDDIRAVAEVLKSERLTQGPMVDKFEGALARYCGARFAVSFSSGTAALHGAYFAAGLKDGDEFITTPLTFAATANAGLYLGARPAFADIDAFGNLDPNGLEACINSKTKLISAVDYAGNPVRINEIKVAARKYGLVFVEDAAHALGASYRGKKIGSLADMTIFSFHPVKSITTGEGGAVLTNNKAYYNKLKLFRSHGITREPRDFLGVSAGKWYSEMQIMGYNYRLTDIQSALGLSQLKKLDKFIVRRRQIAQRYLRELADLSGIELPKETGGANSSWHLFVVRLKSAKRAVIFDALQAAGIGVQVHYMPVYWHPYYQNLGYKKGLCPRAENFYESVISLPIFPDLSAKNQRYVIDKIKGIIKTNV